LRYAADGQQQGFVAAVATAAAAAESELGPEWTLIRGGTGSCPEVGYRHSSRNVARKGSTARVIPQGV
jgi:hypothetical protein